MFAVMGITGQVGGAVARNLLSAGAEVRAVVRDAARAKPWAERGCSLALADIHDPAALTAAFAGTEGAFVMLPSLFDPAPGFPEARAMIAALRSALQAAKPGKVVVLSTIGADATRPNLLTQLGLLEQGLADLPIPVTFLRAAWFMENAQWDVAPARETGVIHSFLQPLDRPIPMVSSQDVGATAAALLRESWSGERVIELQGPEPVTPNDIASAFAAALGRPVQAGVVPHDRWEMLFRELGMKNPEPRVQMLDGINEGWIAFHEGGAQARRGDTGLETVIRGLVAKS